MNDRIVPQRLCSPAKLPSNAVVLRSGSDGFEPREIEARSRRAAQKCHSRFTIAVNTYYPELSGGFYYNRAVIAQVQHAMTAAGFIVIQYELFADSFPIPNELEGALVDNEEYLVVVNGRIVGDLLLWQMSAGGGGAYYDDAVVLDFHLEPESGHRLFEAVRAECQTNGINIALVK